MHQYERLIKRIEQLEKEIDDLHKDVAELKKTNEKTQKSKVTRDPLKPPYTITSGTWKGYTSNLNEKWSQ